MRPTRAAFTARPETVRRQIGAAEAAEGKAVILKSAFGPFRVTMRAHVQKT